MRPINVTIAFLSLIAISSTLLLIEQPSLPKAKPSPQLLNESVRPGGGWFAALTQPASRPIEPDAPKNDRQKEIIEALRQYRQADVNLEFDTAWAKGDKEFVAVMADGEDVPGITDDDQRTFRFGVKVIPNTSDCPASAEESAFQRIANRFAHAYNKLLLKRLQQQRADDSGNSRR